MTPDRWLIRMNQWARNPPSMKRVMLWAGVIALCLGIYGLEKAGLLPAWMEASRPPPVRSLP